MSKLFITMLMATLTIALVSAGNAIYVTPKDLVAYWSFDEGSGKAASDKSGHNYEGAVKDAEWTKEGKLDGAMVFNGTGAYVEVPSDPGLDPGKDNWTIDLWLKRADAGTDWQKILTKYPCCNWTGYRIGLYGSAVHVIFGTGPAPDMVEFTSQTTIVDEEWHHLALVLDRKADAIIYIDGEPDATTASIKHIGEVITTQNLEIGRCHWCGGGLTMGFNGTIDEVKIWRAALTKEEIASSMAGKLGAAVYPEDNLPTTWGNVKESY